MTPFIALLALGGGPKPLWQDLYGARTEKAERLLNITTPKQASQKLIVTLWVAQGKQPMRGALLQRTGQTWTGSLLSESGVIATDAQIDWAKTGETMLKQQLLTFPDQALLPKDKVVTSPKSQAIILRVAFNGYSRRFGYMDLQRHKRFGDQTFLKLVGPLLKAVR